MPVQGRISRLDPMGRKVILLFLVGEPVPSLAFMTREMVRLKKMTPYRVDHYDDISKIWLNLQTEPHRVN